MKFEELILLAFFFVIWYVVMRWIFPAAGIPT
jgi:hypothetical protein